MKSRATIYGLRLFSQAEHAARVHAKSRSCPVWIIRTKRGFRIAAIEPTIGQFWKVEPTGQLIEHAAPVV